MNRLSLANKITIARIISIPFFIAAVIYSRLDIALVIFGIAIASDVADGLAARMLKQKTALGTVLDPVADKLLLVSAYICLAMVDHIPPQVKMPPYVPIVVISRDAMLVLGSVIIYFIKGDLEISPGIAGKITTFFQMITIMAILLHFKYAYIIWNIAAILTVVSGIGYVVKGTRMLAENNVTPKKAA